MDDAHAGTPFAGNLTVGTLLLRFGSRAAPREAVVREEHGSSDDWVIS